MITIKTPQPLKNSMLLSPFISDYLKSLCLTSLTPVWLDKQSNTVHYEASKIVDIEKEFELNDVDKSLLQFLQTNRIELIVLVISSEEYEAIASRTKGDEYVLSEVTGEISLEMATLIKHRLEPVSYDNQVNIATYHATEVFNLLSSHATQLYDRVLVVSLIGLYRSLVTIDFNALSEHIETIEQLMVIAKPNYFLVRSKGCHDIMIVKYALGIKSVAFSFMVDIDVSDNLDLMARMTQIKSSVSPYNLSFVDSVTVFNIPIATFSNKKIATPNNPQQYYLSLNRREIDILFLLENELNKKILDRLNEDIKSTHGKLIPFVLDSHSDE